MGMALGIVSIVGSVLGAAMQGYSSYQSNMYNAQVARNNQIVADRNAATALEVGQSQEEAKRLQTGEMIGSLKASEAASGVNPNTGSALDVRSSAAQTGEMDALTIRYNANVQNQNLKYQGAMFGAQAQLDESMAGWGVANSILGGASSVSNKWLQFNMMGVPGFSGFGNQQPNPLFFMNA